MLVTNVSTPTKIGFFGGSFDPIHLGNTAVIEQAVKGFGLEKVLLCPAYHAPLRSQKPIFEPKQRLEMAELVAQSQPRVQVFDFEIKQKKISYTYDTIRAVKKKYPSKEVFLLIGFDQFERLANWKWIKELCAEVKFLVFARKYQNPPSKPLEEVDYFFMQNPLIDISSSQIRNLILNGKSISELVPEVIFSYLRKNNLLLM